ncbi:MAG: hypothetical protein J6Q56_04110 [Clostridia bacterium]|nr:hypothetical protein [Clostridia bacterium]
MSFKEGIIPVLSLSLSLLAFWDNALHGPSNIVRWLALPLVYIIGYGLVIPKEEGFNSIAIAEKRAKTILLVMSLGFFVHFALNWLININNHDSNRNTIDIWTGVSRAATGQAVLACMMIGIFVAMIFSTTGTLKKLLAIVGLCITAVYNFQLGTRSIFVMILVAAFCALVYMFGSRQGDVKRLRTLIFSAILIFILVILYQNDAWGVKTSFEDSNFYNRFFSGNDNDITDDSRFDITLKYMSYMPKYLFGGNKISKIVAAYPHNVFLDIYDVAGLFAFISVVVIAINALTKLLKVLKLKEIQYETRQMLLCVYVLMLLQLFAEPIFTGAPILLVAFVMLYGTVSRLNDSIKFLY